MIEDCGFVYYGRHFRSADGSIPPGLRRLAAAVRIGLDAHPAGRQRHVGSRGGRPARKMPHCAACWTSTSWEKVVRAFPFVAHWIDAEPITDVKLMAKIEDRQRTYVVDGRPVATGVVPARRRLGLHQPVARARHLDGHRPCGCAAVDAPRDAARRSPGARRAMERAHRAARRAILRRHAGVRSSPSRRGRSSDRRSAYETDDPGWVLGQALATSIMQGSRSAPRFHRDRVVARLGSQRAVAPWLAERALALADPTPLPGPDRAELLSLVGA